MKNFPFYLVLATMLGTLACSEQYLVATQETRTYQIRSAPSQSDLDEIESLVAPYRAQLSSQMSEVIAEVSTPLWKARPESPLGNLLSDVLVSYLERKGQHVDFATLNYSGVRIPSVGKGPLVVEKVYELMPFDNILVTMRLEGKLIQQLLDQIAGDGGWPISKGISFVISDGVAVDIKIQGQALDPMKDYTVALPDYIANGGKDCDFLIDRPRRDFDGALLRDVLIEEIRLWGEAGSLSADIENRITLKPRQ